MSKGIKKNKKQQQQQQQGWQWSINDMQKILKNKIKRN